MAGDKDKKTVDETARISRDGDREVTGDEAKLRLVEAFINTPEDQLSSMTSLQPNLPVPLSMMENYDLLFEILIEDVERFARWQVKRAEYVEGHKDDTIDRDVEVMVEVPPEEESVPEQRKGWRGWFSRKRKRTLKPVMTKEIQVIQKREITWGPKPTAEEIEDEELRQHLVDKLLTKAFRLSLYKHRRSVGGIHRMSTVDLAKEEMAMQAGEEEKGLPDWEE